jgi:hypothetical protein
MTDRNELGIFDASSAPEDNSVFYALVDDGKVWGPLTYWSEGTWNARAFPDHPTMFADDEGHGIDAGSFVGWAPTLVEVEQAKILYDRATGEVQ